MQVRLVQEYDVMLLSSRIDPSGHFEHNKKELTKSRRRSREFKKAILSYSLNQGRLWEGVLCYLMEQSRSVVELPVTKKVVDDVVGRVCFVHVVCNLLEYLAVHDSNLIVSG